MISVGLVVAAEAATIAVVALLAVRAVRRVRRHGGAVTPITGSFEDTLATVIPRRAARLLLFELHGWNIADPTDMGNDLLLKLQESPV